MCQLFGEAEGLKNSKILVFGGLKFLSTAWVFNLQLVAFSVTLSLEWL